MQGVKVINLNINIPTMPRFDEETECHFVPGLECKWPQSEDSMKANITDGGSEDVHSLRPYEYTGTCTNCLLSMRLGNSQPRLWRTKFEFSDFVIALAVSILTMVVLFKMCVGT